MRAGAILLLIIPLILFGCNKKEEEIKELEQSMQESEPAAVDTTTMTDTAPEMEEETGMMVDEESADDMGGESDSDIHADYSGYEGYVAQIGSYATMDFAEYIAKIYQEREYPAFITQAQVDGETYYRVRVGVYSTFEEAKQVGELLKDRYSAEYWVDNNR